jgi:multiple antibiotic resistance protein
MFNIKEILTVSMILFAVIDVIGSIPIIIELRNRTGRIQSEKATIASLVIMVLFLFLGEFILTLIGIDVASFAIAGSFVLFFIALEMILGIKLYKEDAPDSASIVPLAFPLIAGTGTLTTLLSIKSQYSTQNIIAGIIINLIFVYIVLKTTHFLEGLLGNGGINVLRKIFGVVLLAIAVKLFRSNAGI